MSERGRNAGRLHRPASDRPAARVSLFARLQQRKLFHWGVAYLAAAWLLLQLLGLLADFFEWPSVVGRLGTVVLGIGFAAALILAWYHGEKGSQRVSAMELAIFAVLALIAGVAVGFVGGGLRSRADRGGGARAGANAANPGSIAVLPFESVSPDRADEYLAQGFHDELITTLSRVGTLTVISRTSVMGYRGTTKKVREIARELGVSKILEGSVRKAGNRLRVTAQLIDADADRHLWAESYDRELNDLLAIQAELATRIAEALEAKLTPEQKARLEKRPTRDKRAYDLYLRAEAIHNENAAPQIDSAVRLYREAIRLDPAFAAAYAALSFRFAQRVDLTRSGMEWADSGIATARAAIARDSTLAPAYRVLGINLRRRGQLRESTAAIRRALDIEPRYALAMSSLAWNEFLAGNYDEAVIWTTRGMPLDPRYPNLADNLGITYVALGDDSAAERWFAHSLSISPTHVLAKRDWALLDLLRGRIQSARRRTAGVLARNPGDDVGLLAATEAAEAAGDWPAAVRYAERLYAVAPRVEANGGASAALHLAVTLLHVGQAERAQALLDEELRQDTLAVREGADAPEYPYRIAAVYALRGRTDAALDWLGRAHLAGWNFSRDLATAPFFAELRSDPRFARLLGHMDRRVRAMRERAAALGVDRRADRR